MFRGFIPTLGYGFGLVWYFWFSRRFLDNQQNLRENQQYQRNPKNTKQSFGKTTQTKCSKVSDPPLDMGLVMFGCLVFPKVFRQPNKPSGKPNIQNKTKETKQSFGKTKQTQFLKVSDPPLDLGLVLFFVGGFSRRFLDNQKNLRENQKNKQDQTHIQGCV